MDCFFGANLQQPPLASGQFLNRYAYFKKCTFFSKLSRKKEKEKREKTLLSWGENGTLKNTRDKLVQYKNANRKRRR